MCLKLSLLSLPHHLCLIYINHLLSLVVQVDFILNFCLWICFNPILEFQHTFLPQKGFKLGNVLWLLYFSTISLLDPLLVLLRKFGGASSRQQFGSIQLKFFKWIGYLQTRQKTFWWIFRFFKNLTLTNWFQTWFQLTSNLVLVH